MKKILVIGGTLGLTTLVGFAMTLDVWAMFRGDPIIIRGKVVEKEELADVNSKAWIFRPLFGHDIVLNVERAVKIGRDGSITEDRKFLGPKKEVPASRRVHHQAKEDQDVFLVCTSTERAIATLSDLGDPDAAKEIMAALAAEPAPDPGS
jgi:hypothetical protein